MNSKGNYTNDRRSKKRQMVHTEAIPGPVPPPYWAKPEGNSSPWNNLLILPTSSNDIRQYRLVSRSQPCLLLDTAKSTLSWSYNKICCIFMSIFGAQLCRSIDCGERYMKSNLVPCTQKANRYFLKSELSLPLAN